MFYLENDICDKMCHTVFITQVINFYIGTSLFLYLLWTKYVENKIFFWLINHNYNILELKGNNYNRYKFA